MKANFLIIGDLSGRRVKSFVDCLTYTNENRYKIISWIDILDDISNFEKNINENTIIKLEPPEKNMEIYRKFLKVDTCNQKLSEKEIDNIDFSNYQIVEPEQWYQGFKTTLESMDKIYKENSSKNIFCMNDFKETLVMMDKSKTYYTLKDKVKEYDFCLPLKLETPKTYKEFKEIYGDKFIRCFIKLRYGSGGTGVIAYRNNPRTNDENIFTSLNYESLKGKKIFYSNSKVNFFSSKDIVEPLIDWVLSNGPHIEEWIPKTSYKRNFFDTRAFVINKKAEYLISRLSKSPITNLHLRNKRADSLNIVSKENIEIISKAAEDVMKIFNKSLYGGIDVVCSKNYRPYIIDVNPFGDLFHNLIGTDKNVHYLEIKKAIEILRSEA